MADEMALTDCSRLSAVESGGRSSVEENTSSRTSEAGESDDPADNEEDSPNARMSSSVEWM